MQFIHKPHDKIKCKMVIIPYRRPGIVICILLAIFGTVFVASGCGTPTASNNFPTASSQNPSAASTAQVTSDMASGPAITAQISSPKTADGLGVIGVVLPTMDGEYYTRLADGFSKIASENGFDVKIYTSDEAGGEIEAMEVLISEGVKSVIVDMAGPDDDMVQNVKALSLETGIPCVLILDDGETQLDETKDNNVAVVSVDVNNLGMFMMNQCPDINGGTLDILDARLFIIGKDQENPITQSVVNGLYFDSDGTILKRDNIDILGASYVDETQQLPAVVSDVLRINDVDTFICIDRNLSEDLMDSLVSAGFRGNLLCYTYETTAEKMENITGDISVVFVYIQISRLVEESFDTAMTQAIFGDSYDADFVFAVRESGQPAA